MVTRTNKTCHAYLWHVYSTQYGTMMALLQYDKTLVVNSGIVAQCTVWGSPCPMGSLYKDHQGERTPSPLES
jgi:hypothetical protein